MPNLNNFPIYFETYLWDDKHKLYGYPADSYPEFSWVHSLEKRFQWLKSNCTAQGISSIYLIREMIQWGGSQNGVLQKFDDGIGDVNLQLLIKETISQINSPDQAISCALRIPGMGLTYASKLLRFLEPNKYGALDSRVRKAINDRLPGILPRIYDGNINSMVKGYEDFICYLASLAQQLEAAGINRPVCDLPLEQTVTGWRAADIEMALFRWAESNDQE